MNREGGEFQEADGSMSYRGFNQKLVDAARKQKGLPPKNVKSLTFGEMKEIFEDQFVNVNGINKLPDDMLPLVLDFAFNSGAGNAVKTLQKTVGAKTDGIIGKKTLKKLETRFKNDINDFVDTLSNERINFINEAAITNPDVRQFQAGILNRANSVRDSLIQ